MTKSPTGCYDPGIESITRHPPEDTCIKDGLTFFQITVYYVHECAIVSYRRGSRNGVGFLLNWHSLEIVINARTKLETGSEILIK
jgi:hypothetical protein